MVGRGGSLRSTPRSSRWRRAVSHPVWGENPTQGAPPPLARHTSSNIEQLMDRSSGTFNHSQNVSLSAVICDRPQPHDEASCTRSVICLISRLDIMWNMRFLLHSFYKE